MVTSCRATLSAFHWERRWWVLERDFLNLGAAIVFFPPYAFFLRRAIAPKRWLKRSTRPAVSITRCAPVQNGWDSAVTSTTISGYSLPSSHGTVGEELAVEWVRNWVPVPAS